MLVENVRSNKYHTQLVPGQSYWLLYKNSSKDLPYDDVMSIWDQISVLEKDIAISFGRSWKKKLLQEFGASIRECEMFGH